MSCFGLRCRPFRCVKDELAIPDVLSSEPDHVGSPLPGKQQERQRKPRLRSYRMTLLELSNFFRSPTMKSGRTVFELLNIASGIIRARKVCHPGAFFESRT